MEESPELQSRYTALVEKTGWLQVLLSMLAAATSSVATPSYGVVLGFWGAYCAYSKNGKAVFGYICFLAISVVLDIVYCALYARSEVTSAFQFAITMLIFNMFAKLAALFAASHLFAALGGAWSMSREDTAVHGGSVYSSVGFSVPGTYRPPPDPMAESQESMGSAHFGGAAL